MEFNKKIILLDIDDTLFDVEKFRQKILRQIIKTVGYKKGTENIEKKLQEIYIASRRLTGFFNLNIFIKDLIRELNIKTKPRILESLIFKDTLFRGNLYKEAKEILNILSRKKLLRIGIFSRGYKNFQIKKIKEVENLLHKEHTYIFIFKDKKLPSIIEKYKKHKLYIVDDLLKILYTAKSLNKNVYTIWIKRGRFAETQEPIPNFTPDATITNLREVVDIVERSFQ